MPPNQHHPPSGGAPILEVAAALGLEITGRNVACFNGDAHQSGRDEHPSLVLFSNTNLFKCFACGKHGDAIDLVRGYKSCGFREAVDWIRAQAGPGSLPQVGSWAASPAPATRRHPDKSALKVYQSLYDLCPEIKKESPESRYLWGRRLKRSIAAQIGARRIVKPDVVWSKLRGAYEDEELEDAGLVSKRGGFLFRRHTLLFFYVDGDHPVYVQARDITGEADAKELNANGLSSPVPFNRNVLKPGLDEVYVCEGCIDTLSAVQMGLSAVGVPGVAGFQVDWFRLFEGVKQVHILFDTDAAGRHGERLRTDFLLRGFRADAVHPAHGEDVNEMLQILSRK